MDDYLETTPVEDMVAYVLPWLYAIRDFIGDFTGSTHVLTLAAVVIPPALVLVVTALRRIIGGECTRMVSVWWYLVMFVTIGTTLLLLTTADGTTFEQRTAMRLVNDGLWLGVPLAAVTWLVVWMFKRKQPVHCDIS